MQQFSNTCKCRNLREWNLAQARLFRSLGLGLESIPAAAALFARLADELCRMPEAQVFTEAWHRCG